MKIEQKITATFTPEEREIVHEMLLMFENYEDDWELLEQCFYDELSVNMDDWFNDLAKIHNYIQTHS